MSLAIEHVYELPLDRLTPLIEESTKYGFRFPRRLADEWQAGTNRFARPGETLLAACSEDRIIGICGLNVDPYAGDSRTGRVRHLYVAIDQRRRGVGTSLVSAIIAQARQSFDLLRLRTDDPDAAQFYETLGFERSADLDRCSHVLELREFRYQQPGPRSRAEAR